VADESKEKEVARFQVQCLLLDNLDVFQKKGAQLTYQTFNRITGKSDIKTINDLLNPRGIEVFDKITPAQIASMVPYVKLFKTIGRGSKETFLEIPFEQDNQDLEEMLKNRSGRGAGIGIKSFSWDFKGDNPATTGKLIDAKMEIFFPDPSALTRTVKLQRADGGDGGNFQYIDLIVPPQSTRAGPEFQYKIAVGWSIPGEKLKTELFDKQKLDQVKKIAAVLTLDKIKHQLSFEQDGRVKLGIDFIARYESLFSDLTIDVLGFAENNVEQLKESLKNVESYKNRIDKALGDEKCEKVAEQTLKPRETALSRDGVVATTADSAIATYRVAKDAASSFTGIGEFDLAAATERELEDLTELIESKIKEETDDPLFGDSGNQKRYQRFLNRIYGSGRVFQTVIPADKLEEYGKQLNDQTRQAPPDKIEDIKISSTKPDAPDVDDDPEPTSTDDSGNKKRILFTYVGAILESGFKNANAITSNMRVLVGSDKVSVQRNGQTTDNININIADIPVSLDLFNQWYWKNVVGKNRSSYPVKEFLRDVIGNLSIAARFPRCGDPDQKIPQANSANLQPIPFTLPLAPGGKDRLIGTQGARDFNRSEKDISIETIKKKVENMPRGEDAIKFATANYLFLSSTYLDPVQIASASDPTTRRKSDMNKGIYHLRTGQSNGMVKSINFERQDIQGATEARIVSSATSKDSLIASSEIYDANVTMIGNNLVNVGSLIFVGLPNVGSDDGKPIMERLGLQGYYRVINSNSFIESGKYETQIKAKFETNTSFEKENAKVQKDDGCQVLREFASEYRKGKGSAQGQVARLAGAEAALVKREKVEGDGE
jgi:hypothetical protein